MDELHENVKQCIESAEQLAPVEAGPPTTEFLNYFARHKGKLSMLLTDLKADEPKVAAFELRAGLMPSKRAVVDPLIQEFCRLPYRTPDGVIPSCPGITRGLHGCPPHAPPTAQTGELFRRAGSLLVLQFEGQEGNIPQGEIHHFLTSVICTLQEQGYLVSATYATGPCKVCSKGCRPDEKCRFPERKLFSLEACGIWVPSVCSGASEFPIVNGGPRQIRWLRDWRLPTQNSNAVRYTAGVLLE